MQRDAGPQSLSLEADAGRMAARTSFPGSPALAGLVADGYGSWETFRRGLAPRYDAVWRDVAVSYLCIGLGVVVHAAIALRAGNAVGLVLAPLAALWIGYWVAGLMCFMHEAAHFNLHADKARNDRLANLLICSLIGEQVARYRAVHWHHHLHLGDINDSEVSYHQAPTPRFVVEALCGIQALRVLTRRGVLAPDAAAAPIAGRVRGLLRGFVLHGSVLAILVALGAWSTALAWVLAIGMIYPFANAMRQLLEHRSASAVAGVDYTRVAHGPVNRLFGTDLFSRTFGPAGFNRHLLHHWYPAASYTTFDELERFWMRSALAPRLDDARTTYWAAWRALTRSAGRRAPS